MKFSLLHRHWGLLKIYLLFGLSISLIFIFLTLPPVLNHLIIPLNEFLAWSSATFLEIFSESQITHINTIISSPIFSVNIAEGCNGIYVISIFIAGIIALPSNWKKKSIGFGIGIPLLFLLNYFRILTLWYTGAYAPSLFSALHVYVWDVIIIVAGILIWLFWYERWVDKK